MADDIAVNGLKRVSIFPERPMSFLSARAQMDAETREQKLQAKTRSMEIDKYLKEEGKKLDPRNHVFVLLLGPSDAGKSTVLKQIIIQNGGFDDKARREQVEVIQKQILNAVKKMINYTIQNNTQWNIDKKLILECDPPDGQPIDQHVLEALMTISQSDVAKALLDKCDELSIPHSCKILFPNTATLLKPDYTPSDEEILLGRRRTEKISETKVTMDGKYWHFVDVAGHKDKRSRWTAYMEKGVQGVVYVFSCASYNQCLEEESSLNMIRDAQALFMSIVSNPILKLKSIIVMLNKYDLLDEKIKNHDIKQSLPDYPGEQTKESYLTWLVKQFNQVALDHNVEMTVFKTTATDTNLMTKIMSSVRKCILKTSVERTGL
ncbi:guanine nucleotide binding protein, alpha subunit [Gorgonomyces haynaldii]|nr:guanine nucleotide binding protein, alpha subunit [Gorgonomyces haynaldii]